MRLCNHELTVALGGGHHDWGGDMWSFSKNVKSQKRGLNSYHRVVLKSNFYLALVVPLVAGCTIASNQLGPTRPITIDDDVLSMRSIAVAAPEDLKTFYDAAPSNQASMRNQIVTARMYIADMEYHTYEARLTREMQDEGLLATAVSLGLTTSATLIPVTQTKTLLSGIATGVTGLDKAYNEKELLSNTVQALQTQMRADRKTQAAVIYAKMYKDVGNTRAITSIAEYTLPMAFSDADGYYQAGTVASALIGLSKTLATAEHNADHAKSAAGPNPGQVTDAKMRAAPLADQPAVPLNRRPTTIRDVNTPLATLVPPRLPAGSTRIGVFEANMSAKDMRSVLDTLCLSGSSDLGSAGSPARKALARFLTANSKPSSENIDRNVFLDIQDLQIVGKRNCQ